MAPTLPTEPSIFTGRALEVTETMRRHPRCARSARMVVEHALESWDLTDLLDAGKLVASELVTNAVEHTTSSLLRVSVVLDELASVTIAVTDESCEPPRPHVAGAEDDGGRGLAVVAAVSESCGIDVLPAGKRVWARLKADHARRRPGSGASGAVAGMSIDSFTRHGYR